MHTQSCDTHQTCDSMKVVEEWIKETFLGWDKNRFHKHNHFIVCLPRWARGVPESNFHAHEAGSYGLLEPLPDWHQSGWLATAWCLSYELKSHRSHEGRHICPQRKPLEPEWSWPQTEQPRGQVRFMFHPPHNSESVSFRRVCGKRLSSWTIEASGGRFCVAQHQFVTAKQCTVIK